MIQTDEAEDRLTRWGRDPVAFVYDVFGPGYEDLHGEKFELDIWQEQFLRALVTWEPRRYALAACKGPGKSAAESWAGLWFLTTRYDAQVIATSITGDNLKTGLWKEIATWYGLSPMLQQACELTAEKLVVRGSEKTWWCYARSFPKDADTTQQAATLAGFHSKHLMFLGDEAGDYPDGVVAAADGIFANDGEAYLILAGNTTRTSGPLYRAVQNRSGLWWVKRITGDPDAPDRCTRISRSWAEAQIAEHGREHPWVKINVLGEFPDVQSNKLLGPDDIERSQRRNPQKQDFVNEPVIVGIDTALQGDDMTVLVKRQGIACWRPRTWRMGFKTDEAMLLADQIAGVLIAEKPDAVFIDTGGPSGIAVLSRLKELGFRCQGIDFATQPVGDDSMAPIFGNRRAEMYWKASQWVKKHGALPQDTELGVELCEPEYFFPPKAAQTKFWIEPKAEIKKRLSRSPDRADAFALTFAAPVVPKALREAQNFRQSARKDWNPFDHLRGKQ
jgi:phage terminase large subunit